MTGDFWSQTALHQEQREGVFPLQSMWCFVTMERKYFCRMIKGWGPERTCELPFGMQTRGCISCAGAVYSFQKPLWSD